MAFQIVTDLATMDALHAAGLLYVNGAANDAVGTWEKYVDEDLPSEFLAGATFRSGGMWVQAHHYPPMTPWNTYHQFGISVED